MTNETKDTAIENCLRWYIAKTFERASQAYNPSTVTKQTEDANKDYYYGKANQKIPIRALKSNQYNHKIISAYFKAVETTDLATIEMMERLCSDKNNPELYVPTFKNNYSQIKLDVPKSHGKVFEYDGDTVAIWHEVEDALNKYKSSFTY